MAKMFNRARMTVTSTGTGALSLGVAVAGYQTFSSAGAQNGDSVSYAVEDGLKWEIGTGQYNSVAGTLSRTVTQSFDGTTYGTSAISVTTSAQVFISPLAADLQYGTLAGNLVQLDGSARLPAVDGSLVTALNASNISSGTIAAARVPTLNQNTTGTAAGLSSTLVVGSGGTGLTSLTAGYIPYASATNTLGTSVNFQFNGNSLTVGASGFTSTLNAGNAAIGGIGIYPYTTATSGTNSTNYSSLNIENATSWTGNSGASAQSYYSLLISPKISNSGSGGTSTQSNFGIGIFPTIQSSGATANTSLFGLTSQANRANVNDLGTTPSLVGGQFIGQHLTSLTSTVTSSQISGIVSNAVNQSGIATNLEGSRVVILMGSAAGAGTTSATNVAAFRNVTYSIGAATGNTATVTNAYGVNILGPTVAATGTVTNYYGFYQSAATVTGTLTNRWGVYIDDTVAGNYFGGSVGIGTTSTSLGKLTVQGTGSAAAFLLNGLSSTDVVSDIYINRSSSTTSISAAPGIRLSDGTNNRVIQSGAGNLQFFRYSGSWIEDMRLDASGNVGIGTAPSSKLHVANGDIRVDAAGASALGEINFGYTGGNAGLKIAGVRVASNNDQHLLFYTSSTATSGVATERVRIDNLGNLGLGVTPSAWASIRALQFSYGAIGADSSGYPFLVNNGYESANGTWTRITGSLGSSRYRQQFGNHAWDIAASGVAGGTLAWTQAMTLDTSSNLSVLGQLSTTKTGNFFLSNGASTTNQYFSILNTGGSFFLGVENSGGGSLATGTAAYSTILTTQGSTVLAFGTNLVERARIDASGNLLVGATGFGTGGGNGGKIAVANTPSSQWGIDFSNAATGNISNGSNYAFGAGSGLIFITESGVNGASAIYLVGGGATTLVSTSSATYWDNPTTTPAAGKASITYSGTAYTLYNNQGGTRNFYVAMIKTRNAN